MYRSIVIADPSLLEEKRSEATFVFGINSYRELCGLHFGGITIASLEQLVKCANQGSKRANSVVKQIKDALDVDEKKRTNGQQVGFMKSRQYSSVDACNEDRVFIRLAKFRLAPTEEMERELDDFKKEQAKIKSLGTHSAMLMPAEELSSEDECDMWIPDLDGDIEPILQEKHKTTPNIRKESKQFKNESATSDDSEEEETVIMENIT